MRTQSIESLRKELEANQIEIKKLTDKIDTITERNKQIESKIFDLENAEYIKYIRENEISLDELMMLREKFGFEGDK